MSPATQTYLLGVLEHLLVVGCYLTEEPITDEMLAFLRQEARKKRCVVWIYVDHVQQMSIIRLSRNRGY